MFRLDGVVYRQVNHVYRENYESLMRSGLYHSLVQAGLLIEHEEVGEHLAQAENAYKVIRPERVPFISYPYEWCFSQLKAAALATLDVQRRALHFGMSVKDASAYNMQFVRGKPTLIDTLSFEVYREGRPWVAYRQFCQHFLAPLALVSYGDVRLQQFLRIFIDGIPLDLAATLLPISSWLRIALLVHLHLHVKCQHRLGRVELASRQIRRTMGRHSLLGLIDHLESAVQALRWKPRETVWTGYTPDESYKAEGVQHKEGLVAEFLEEVGPRSVWDLGANTGRFSRISSRKGRLTVSFDSDPGAVELNYLHAIEERDTHLLPLVIDLTNPSPGIGWNNQERSAWLDRGPADAVLALALVHHLAISNNVPLDRLAQFFSQVCRWLIIEFVPKSDPKVQTLLAAREDIFPNYTKAGFEAGFSQFFRIRRVELIKHSERVLSLMEKR